MKLPSSEDVQFFVILFLMSAPILLFIAWVISLVVNAVKKSSYDKKKVGMY